MSRQEMVDELYSIFNKNVNRKTMNITTKKDTYSELIEVCEFILDTTKEENKAVSKYEILKDYLLSF